jgi:hypothetical protein
MGKQILYQSTLADYHVIIQFKVKYLRVCDVYCPDLVSEGAKDPDPVFEDAKHIHFSQFSCEKRIKFAPSKARPGYFGWYDYYY